MKYAKFFYLARITSENCVIPFSEDGVTELDAVLPTGYYTPDSMQTAIAIALSATGALTYTASFNRTTRLFTISSTANFSLLTHSTNASLQSPYSILGFSTAADLVGASSYTGTSFCGKQYSCQFPLEDYSAPDTLQMFENATVFKSANGKNRELYTTGGARFAEMNVKYITSRADLTSLEVIRGNKTGKEDAIAFMAFATAQGLFEFMEDGSDPNTFLTMALDSTPQSNTGTSFNLKAIENLPGFFETGTLKMRVIE